MTKYILLDNEEIEELGGIDKAIEFAEIEIKEAIKNLEDFQTEKNKLFDIGIFSKFISLLSVNNNVIQGYMEVFSEKIESYLLSEVDYGKKCIIHLKGLKYFL